VAVVYKVNVFEAAWTFNIASRIINAIWNFKIGLQRNRLEFPRLFSTRSMQNQRWSPPQNLVYIYINHLTSLSKFPYQVRFFYDMSIWLWNCSISVIFFVFHFIKPNYAQMIVYVNQVINTGSWEPLVWMVILLKSSLSRRT
jgi:hypothetical protein